MRRTAPLLVAFVLVVLTAVGCAKRTPAPTPVSGTTGATPTGVASTQSTAAKSADAKKPPIGPVTSAQIAAKPFTGKPTAGDILNRTAEVYKAAKTLRMEAVTSMSMSMGSNKRKSQGTISVEAARPNKLKVVVQEGKTLHMMLTDGKVAYAYSAAKKLYARSPAPARLSDAAGGKDQGISTLALLDGMDISPYAKRAKFLPSQKLAGVDTYVISCPLTVKDVPGMTAGQRVWIGKKDFLMRKLVIFSKAPASAMAGMPGPKPTGPLVANQETVVRSITLDSPIPATDFHFTPPAGSKELKQQPSGPGPRPGGPGPGVQPGGPRPGPGGPGAPPPDGSTPPKPSGVIPGQKAPGFTIPTLDGKNVSLSDYKGKHVLVLFWSTQSPMSKKGMPEFEKLQKEIAGKGITILGVNLDKTKDVVAKFIKEEGVTFPILFDYNKAYDLATEYSGGQFGLPVIYVVGPDGVVKGTIPGAESAATIKSRLDKLGVR